jgi:DNA-binding transcriptional regulator YdaS (Cro superfamily)
MDEKTGIQQAVELFDNSSSKLAAAVGSGVLRQHVEHWLKAGRVSAERCPEVSVATGIPLELLNDRVNWKLARKPARRTAKQEVA